MTRFDLRARIARGWLAPVAALICLPLTAAAADPAGAALSAPVLAALEAGKPRDLIVLLDARTVDADLAAHRTGLRLARDDARVRALRQAGYRKVKDDAMRGMAPAQATWARDFPLLPMGLMRVRSARALERLLRQPGVLAVYENLPLRYELSQSLPLIAQPRAAGNGRTGAGTTVAVLDTGVDYRLPEFGNCTAPGIPSGCRVAASIDIASEDGALDADGHGTNVAATVSGVAPGARIAMADVFVGQSATTADVIAGIDWAIANRDALNIVALNLSLGDSSKFTLPCDQPFGPNGNPFLVPISNARDAGIVTVAAAGNNGYTDGMPRPACTSQTLSVGAVYDSNLGSRSWNLPQGGTCSDPSTAADLVACFSNTAPFLDVLAPGALITAGGFSYGGTSEAAPHVAGAIAVLRAAFPGDSLAATEQRLLAAGVPVTDVRTSPPRTLPRLDFTGVFPPPANDAFAARAPLVGAGGTLVGSNDFASKEPGEPLHAGDAGGKSVWWRYVAPMTGTLSLTTKGSDFDSLLAVYVGGAIDGLTPVAGNDDAGSPQAALAVPVAAGVEYQIAVDGKGGARGALALAWSMGADRDGDGLGDSLEAATCTSEDDADSDDDGVADGDEDADRDGLRDAGETDPCAADSDGDGLGDGLELGRFVGVPDPDGAGPLLGTDPAIFTPDANPRTTTSPLASDSDGDGFADGDEDGNRNGALDPGESDPGDPDSVPAQPLVRSVPLPPWALAGLLILAAGTGVRATRRRAGRGR